MTIKGKQKRLDDLCKSFGSDPLIKMYVDSNRTINRGYWHNSIMNGENCIVLLPYVKIREDRYDWTEDKITFDSLEKCQNFCNHLGIELLGS